MIFLKVERVTQYMLREHRRMKTALWQVDDGSLDCKRSDLNCFPVKLES